MSELGNKIKLLRAKQAQVQFAEKAGISLRTVCKLEAGEPVSLETVQQISRSLRLPEPERLELIVSWLKIQIGDDFNKLIVQVKDQPSAFRDSDQLLGSIQLLLSDTPRKLQEQIHVMLQRPEILPCLKILNDLYDSLKGRGGKP